MSVEQPGEERDQTARLRARLDRERRARHEAEQISERITRELYERQQELALLVDVARAANECADVRDALALAIERVCRFTGWPVGHVYLVEHGENVRPSGIWHLDPPERFAVFREITEQTHMEPGAGLPGRVLSTGGPVWVPDVMTEVNFPRARTDVELNVRGGFGFPILVGTDIVGVMEFYNVHVVSPNPQLLEMMAQIGTELGRAIERDRARAGERRLLTELSVRAAELERSNEDLEQFASIASHDLQEPLRKVQTFTQRIEELEGENLSDQGRDYLQRASGAASRMQTLITDLLAFSRVSTRGRPFVEVDLAQVTGEVMSDLEHAVERSGAVVEVGVLPTVAADPMQMRQLIQNLLSNAIKFHHPDRAPEISISGEVTGDTVQLVVTDNGIGFDPQYRHRIFRVFERLHGRSSYEGTGIGLALCRKITERHGGRINAVGVPDGGATVTVELPRTHQDEASEPFAVALD